MRNWVDHYLKHRPLLLQTIGQIVHPDDVEDVAQDTFLKSLCASRQQRITNPRAYMVRTARNLALNHVQSRAYQLNRSIEDVGEEALPVEPCPLEAQYDSSNALNAFYTAVDALPPGCRRVFVMKKLEGYSLKAIASALGISPRTVEKQVSNGIASTHGFLARRGYSREALLS